MISIWEGKVRHYIVSCWKWSPLPGSIMGGELNYIQWKLLSQQEREGKNIPKKLKYVACYSKATQHNSSQNTQHCVEFDSCGLGGLSNSTHSLPSSQLEHNSTTATPPAEAHTTSLPTLYSHPGTGPSKHVLAGSGTQHIYIRQ